jgi:preprotein translocase subunit SecD
VYANVALIVNMLLLFAALVSFNAALTLPGLAGIALTVGMAVDANVLIFERIREELRAGKSPRAAVELGFDRAFWTIFDSQLTTALAGIILMKFTTGAIYGFAVTLLIGIITSIFTAIVVTRLCFDIELSKKGVEKLSV